MIGTAAGWAGSGGANGGSGPGAGGGYIARGFRIAAEPFEIGAQLGRGLIAQIAILFERLAEDFFEALRRFGIQLRGRRGRAIQNRVENYGSGVAAKRGAARGHLVEDRAKTKNIGARVEVFAASLLRRHVSDGADGRAGIREHRVAQWRRIQAGSGAESFERQVFGGVLGEAEVENFGLAARGDENIRGLDVAMNNSAGMCGVEGIGNLNGEIEERGERDGAAADAFAEGLAFEQLHNEERTPAGFADVEERADAGMIESGNGAGFALKSFEGGGIVGEIAGEKFEGDEAAEANVFGAENLAHAAAAEGLDDFIV